MKRFEIITEADARRLEIGSTRGAGARAATSRRSRRTRCATGASPCSRADGRDLIVEAPPADITPRRGRAAITPASSLAAGARRAPAGRGLAVDESGATGSDPVDYPGRRRRRGAQPSPAARRDAGIVIDGAGLGSCIAANKIAGIRAAMCTTPTLARYAREHNGANVLTLGATLLTTDEAHGHRRHVAHDADDRAALHPPPGRRSTGWKREPR